MGRPIRVLVVEDSLTVRGRLVEVLSGDPELEVVGEVGDGQEALELCRAQRPDVITLDMMLPVLDGLAVTEQVMAYCPTPILIVSSSVNRGEVFRTYDALAAGAVDVLEKPRGDGTDDGWDERLVAAVKLVSRIPVITHPRARMRDASRTRTPSVPPRVDSAPPAARVIGVGASTGGPSALLEVLRALPAGFPVPILLVVHIAELFAASFADWLGTQAPLRVELARAGEPLPEVGDGRVLLAPAGSHLVLRDRRLRLTSDPERHSCRPSIDVLFESLAREVGAAAVGCLLTGMGRDGASGLLEMRRAGCLTLAQDEATSVVYGMPREAAAIGAARRVLPLREIGPALAELARPAPGRRGA